MRDVEEESGAVVDEGGAVRVGLTGEGDLEGSTAREADDRLDTVRVRGRGVAELGMEGRDVDAEDDGRDWMTRRTQGELGSKGSERETSRLTLVEGGGWISLTCDGLTNTP